MLKALLALPVLTHALLAAAYTAALSAFLLALGAPTSAALTAAVVVSAMFYGREAGQHEHDLKNRGVNPVLAWLGSEFMFLWDASNFAEWLAPAASSAAVGSLFFFLKFGFFSF